MKHYRFILLIVLIIISYAPKDVSSVNSQSLDWGIEEGQRFDFTLQLVQNGTLMIGEEIYLLVADLPEINEAFTSLNRIPLTLVSQYWINGSEYDHPLSWNRHVEHLAYPIGNWYILTTLGEDPELSHYDLVADDQFWGYEWTVDSTTTNNSVTVRAIYLKEDGFLSRYHYRFWDRSTNQTIDFTEAYRPGITLNLLTPIIENLPTIGIISIVLVISYALIRKKRR